MSSMEHQEVNLGQKQNQDLIWDLDSIARRELAERFVELQRQQRVGLWRYLRGSRWSVILTAPIIYAG